MIAIRCDLSWCDRQAEQGGIRSHTFIVVSQRGCADEHYCCRDHAARSLTEDSHRSEAGE